jgi:outer membrane protein W
MKGAYPMSVLRAAGVMVLIAIPIGLIGQSRPATQEPAVKAQEARYALEGKHGLELNVGLLSSVKASTDVSAGGVTTTSGASGFVGSIGYSYWLENHLAVTASVGASDVGAETSAGAAGVYVESATIVPLLFGVKYQPFNMTSGNELRPYVYASVGPYFGFASNVYTGTSTTTEAFSEAVLGSRFGIGLDLSLSRSLFLGFGVAYRLVDDFKNRIGSETNYSGPDFSLTFGFVFGGA